MSQDVINKNQKKCLETEMNAHLAKPIEIENVKKLIYEQINRR